MQISWKKLEKLESSADPRSSDSSADPRTPGNAADTYSTFAGTCHPSNETNSAHFRRNARVHRPSQCSSLRASHTSRRPGESSTLESRNKMTTSTRRPTNGLAPARRARGSQPCCVRAFKKRFIASCASALTASKHRIPSGACFDQIRTLLSFAYASASRNSAWELKC